MAHFEVLFSSVGALVPLVVSAATEGLDFMVDESQFLYDLKQLLAFLRR